MRCVFTHLRYARFRKLSHSLRKCAGLGQRYAQELVGVTMKYFQCIIMIRIFEYILDAVIHLGWSVVLSMSIRADEVNVSVVEQISCAFPESFVFFICKAKCIYLNQSSAIDQHAYHGACNVEVAFHVGNNRLVAMFLECLDDLNCFAWFGIHIEFRENVLGFTKRGKDTFVKSIYYFVDVFSCTEDFASFV